MVIKLYQEKFKENKMGKAPLKFSVHFGKQYWLPAYESVAIGAFKNQRVTAKEEFCSEVNRSLSNRRRAIENIIRKADEDGIIISQKYLAREYKKRADPKRIAQDPRKKRSYSTNFWDYWEDFLQIGVKKYSKEHLRKFKQVKNHLKMFDPDIDFERFDESFEDDYFYSYLAEDLGLTNNTISKHIKCIKAILSYAEKMGCKRVNPVYKSFKDVSIQAKRIFLSWSEVEAIQSLEPIKELDCKVKDLFLFSCLTGLRWQDIHGLSRINFEKRNGSTYINIHSKKTKVNLRNVLTPQAIEILKKYNYELPKISNQKCNEALKRIARGAGLKDLIERTRYSGSQKIVEYLDKWKLVSMHVGRHTFACEFLQRTSSHGLSALKALSEILGHKTTRTTEVYWNMITAKKDEMLLESFAK